MLNYCDTNEASKMWGISARRIVQLAASGRIEGAILVGKTWLIPTNAKKPKDARTKESRNLTDRYIFPYPIVGITSETDLPSHYNEEEKNLCRAQLLYEFGNFEESKQLSEELLAKTRNKYIRLGAIMNLLYTEIFLQNFSAAHKLLIEFRLLLTEPDPHSFELNLLLTEIDATFKGSASIPKPFHSIPVEELSVEGRCYFIASDTMMNAIFSLNKKPSSHVPYDFLAYQTDRDGTFVTSLFMHYYLAILYMNTDKEATQKHLLQSVELAVRHNVLTTLCRLLSYDPATLELITNNMTGDMKEKFNRLAQQGSSSFNQFFLFLGKTNLYNSLTPDDFRLAVFTMKKCTIETIAEELQVSEITVKRRFSALYKKLGVKTRAEFFDLLINVLMNTDIKI